MHHRLLYPHPKPLPSLQTPPLAHSPRPRQPLNLHPQLRSHLTRHLTLPCHKCPFLIPQRTHILRRENSPRPLRAQQNPLNHLITHIVDEALDGDLVVRLKDITDVVNGGVFVAEMDVCFHLGEVDGRGVHLAIFEAEALEAVEEAVSTRGLEVVGEVVVVGEEVAVALIFEEDSEFCFGFGDDGVDGGLNLAPELLLDVCVGADFVEERVIAASDAHENRSHVPGSDVIPFPSLLGEEPLQDNGVHQA